jgi:Uma2 family endonuclease
MLTAATPLPSQNLPLVLGEQRVVFRGLTWLRYQQLLKILDDRRTARLTYDRGTLEITMPLEIHEFSGELIGRLIYFMVVEMGLKVKSIASTTLYREDLDRGAEPDKAYYIQNHALVAGRTVDLAQDPPPDLVLEVDITHTDIDKAALYANMGVPEFWRYDGQQLRFFQLDRGAYVEVEASPTFPMLLKAKVYEFLAQAKADEVEAEQIFRAWFQSAIARQCN